MSEQLTGAQALIRSLELEGVEIVFGVPGGAILPAYDPLLDSPIRHILARHEQGAGHMASGYAHASGKVGVTIATSGPGATNLVTPLADAYADSIPVVAITGQVATTSIGSDAFQEAHTWGITAPCTKHNYLVTNVNDIPNVIREAFHLASTGRPGPVLVDIPKDLLVATMEWTGRGEIDLPGYKPRNEGNHKQIVAAIKLLLESERPVFYAGGGLIRANASEEAHAFAKAANLPVVTTLMGRGVIPDSYEKHLGMSGMHGTYAATIGMQEADLLFTIGARFDDRVTGKVSAFAPHAKVVHVDVDPAEIGKVRNADVPVVGDAKAVLHQLIAEHAKQLDGAPAPTYQPWIDTVLGWRAEHPLAFDQNPDGPILPQYFISELSNRVSDHAIVVAGVGQHQMWASQFWHFERPNTWINSGGLGTMGYAVPAAVGAQAAMPDTTVWVIDGDGCFQMTSQELITAAIEGLPVKIAIMNNGSLGMVKQWQSLFYDGRLSSVDLSGGIPDFVMLAEAMGCVGLRVDHPSEVPAIIEKAIGITDKPVVIDVVCDPDEMVFPMVPAGGSNSDIVLNMEGLQ